MHYTYHIIDLTYGDGLTFGVCSIMCILYFFEQDYWKTKLSDKFRNERKHMKDLGISQPVKRMKKSPGGHAVHHEHCPDGEDEHSMHMHRQ